ncbi:MAG: hypothetical protein IKW02_00220 [Clostridia bacterium]|nr:hypothetical protein [Clostridia bacterium]
MKKIISCLEKVFGYGIMICLFAGGMTFIGYLAALIVGGDTAAAICRFNYEVVLKIVIKASTLLILMGIVVMYFKGEKALTASAGKKEKVK